MKNFSKEGVDIKIIFCSVINKKEILTIESPIHVPSVNEHVYYLNNEYKVDGVLHDYNYNMHTIYVYLRKLNSNCITFRS